MGLRLWLLVQNDRTENYESEAEALAALSQLSDQNAYVDTPDGMRVSVKDYSYMVAERIAQ